MMYSTLARRIPMYGSISSRLKYLVYTPSYYMSVKIHALVGGKTGTPHTKLLQDDPCIQNTIPIMVISTTRVAVADSGGRSVSTYDDSSSLQELVVSEHVSYV